MKKGLPETGGIKVNNMTTTNTNFLDELTYMTNANLFNNLFEDMREEIEAGEFGDYQETFEGELQNIIFNIVDLEEALDMLGEIIENTEDDVREYIDMEDFDYFYYDIDTDNGYIKLESIPECVREHIEELVDDFVGEYEEETGELLEVEYIY